MVDTMNANCTKIEKSWVYCKLSYITYMSNLHVFNHYNVEAFTYYILLELCVTYDTMNVMAFLHSWSYMLYVWCGIILTYNI